MRFVIAHVGAMQFPGLPTYGRGGKSDNKPVDIRWFLGELHVILRFRRYLRNSGKRNIYYDLRSRRKNCGGCTDSGCGSYSTFLQFLVAYHDLSLDEQPRVYIQRWETQARGLQDTECCGPNIRRSTGIYQRAVLPARHSSRGRWTGGFMSSFGSHRHDCNDL